MYGRQIEQLTQLIRLCKARLAKRRAGEFELQVGCEDAMH